EPSSDPTSVLDEKDLQRLVLALSLSSRAVAGAFGTDEPVRQILVAGWADGPPLTPVSMTVAARAVCTAGAALQTRQRAVTTIVGNERARIAYAIHDGLTQAVAGAVLELEALH